MQSQLAKFYQSLRNSVSRFNQPLLGKGPLRRELLTVDEMAVYAEQLAERHRVRTIYDRGRDLLKAFRQSRRVIRRGYFELSEAIHKQGSVIPGAEWLLDNYHIIEQNGREVLQDLPRTYYRKLPKLKRGDHRGYPRALHLAMEFLSHSDSKVEASALASFVAGYQRRKTLTLGELWAIPIMLRMVLIENLRRIVEDWLEARVERVVCDGILARLMLDEDRTGTELMLVLARELKDLSGLGTSGFVYLIRNLRAKGPRASLAVGFLEERLKERDLAFEEVTRLENQSSAGTQITMMHIFTSLRTIGSLNWKKWVEGQSKVHEILLQDPAAVYGQCDFVTRDQYRHRVELIAQQAGRQETAVADDLLELIQERIKDNPKLGAASKHVGAYLVGREQEVFENRVGYRGPLRERLTRFVKGNGTFLYLGSIFVITVAMLAGLLSWANGFAPSLEQLLLLAALLIVPISELASNIVQWFVTLYLEPRPLPKLDLSLGILDESRTLVAVHGIFSEPEAIKRAIEQLEIRFLGNREKGISYALLADLHDAPEETLASDQRLIDVATEEIELLNKRYPSSIDPHFLLLFRRRQWNKSEGKFMGWERKRGKITELNRLIRKHTDISFIFCVGTPEQFARFKYVLTLDLDTQLPRGSAHRLIGTIAHPLNKAVLDPKTRTVVEGYGIVQPRVGTNLSSSIASPFSRIFTGHSGIDPYTHCVSDVYQDLFGEGSFIGKAIFDVEAFETALDGRVPENALLSHDLFEGNLARAGLASDIELLDDFPSRYHVYMRRAHRWVRGDWQLLPWALGFSRRGKDGFACPISALGRWKLFDNLRRSLVAPSILLLLVFSWTIGVGPAWVWGALVAALVAFPLFVNLAGALMPPSRQAGFSLGTYVRGLGEDVGRHTIQAIVSLSFIPHQAILVLGAIVTTLWRLFFSRRHLLEWETAFHAEKRLGGGIASFLQEMAEVPALSAAIIAVVYLFNPIALPVALIFGFFWFFSPAIAALLSYNWMRSQEDLTPEQREKIAVLGFETWCFFDDLLTPENNYLIPDNIQLVPQEVVARRTSPTNISLSMLTVAGASDLGFITPVAALKRLALIAASLEKLERFRGHYLNWYSTERLAPLYPRYVSTVDSGNLVGHFIALKTAIRQILETPLISKAHAEHLKRLIRWTQCETSSQEGVQKTLSTLQNELDQDGPWSWRLFVEGVNRARDQYHDLCNEPKAKRLCDFLEGIHAVASLLPSEAGSACPKVNVSPELRDLSQVITNVLNKVIDEIDFRFLFDEQRKLFAIGYNVDTAQRDNNFYDLLASEARLASLVSIAKSEVNEEHWFMLGRSLTDSPGGRALLSWSGTMFEYLMPVLVTKSYPSTILSKTYEAVLKAQQAYGQKRKVPWGFSESAYSGVDFEKTYQYRAFGVPGLGLKRGLSEDLVVSPYSTVLGLLVDPVESLKNFPALIAHGLHGRYGFYESVDYTDRRLGRGEKSHVVKSFFAHHQGMSFVAIVNTLLKGIFQERFHAEPMIRATEILLQERFPRYSTSLIPNQAEQKLLDGDDEQSNRHNWDLQKLDTPHTEWPVTHVLSNGRYTVMIDNAGSGQSMVERSTALTRWREDDISNRFGTYVYLRDLESEEVWSATYQPSRVEPDRYEVIFSPDKAEFLRRDHDIGVHTEVVVSPEDNLEIRKLTVTNFSDQPRRLELTSYGEVVLGSARGESAHPAFSNMFIESEYLADLDTILFSRRPRSEKEQRTYLFHTLSMNVVWEKTQFETSRMAFLGRGRSVHSPIVFDDKRNLRGEIGAVLDPVFSLRSRIELDAHASQVITFITGFSKSREETTRLAERYHGNLTAATRAFEMAWSHSSVELRVGQYSAEEAALYQRLANFLYFNVDSARISGERISRNRMHQSAFWRFGISGDLPIVFVRILEPSQKKLLQQVLAGHEYLRQRGLTFDLVILNEYPGGYSQDFQHELEFMVRAGRSETLIEKSGGIFLRTVQQISPEETLLLEAIARVVLTGARGELSAQLPEAKAIGHPEKSFRRVAPHSDLKRKTLSQENPEFFNGVGGFTDNGKSYAIDVQPQSRPPLPWSNVIANPNFGFLVTESGGGFTWAENSRENRLTPWSNDFVTDPVSEAVYIRDIATGAYWSPTPAPCSTGGSYRVKHGLGWTTFTAEHEEIRSSLLLCGARSDKVKWYKLKLRNESNEAARNLEVFLYIDLVLGVLREDSYRHLVTNFDASSQTLYAVNNYNNEFAGRLVFIGSDHELTSYTSNRFEFVGRNRDLSSPLALERGAGQRGLAALVSKNQVRLTRKVGAGFNSCAAIQVEMTLEPGEEREVTFFLGEAFHTDDLRASAARYRSAKYFTDEQAGVVSHWSDLTNPIQVETPERGFDVMINSWLMYQTVSCRINGRSGFYQSGGAIGFRDQLQDVMALIHAAPQVTRAQILLHASRQFGLGDVQHWWHPPTGRGVRTTISDDLLWLPYVVDEYISITGDDSILNEEASFLEGPRLEPGHTDMYAVPNVSLRRGTVYEHCILAIERGLQFGEHGLPLMGGGDWNDGMNEVGKEGKGESVWLGWFLWAVLKRFERRATERNDAEHATKYQSLAQQIVKALETYAWDGAWYRRAYFDNGLPLGSKESVECQIDSLAQSWAVITGAGDPQRSRTAMESVYERLVQEGPGVILLLTPAFDKADPNPGYIKGYLPGIRENGAQYTHAATWVVLATAMMGRGTQAMKLFQMLNPISHGDSPEQVARYQGEPYVLCGDVYSNPQHPGRAGWSWYTGSSGWLYRVGVEHILGLKVSPQGFKVQPCIPASWGSFKMWYRHDGTTYVIDVHNRGGVEKGVKQIKVDGQVAADKTVPFVKSASQVQVVVEMG